AALRWLAPSAAAASGGAVLAGALEGKGLGDYEASGAAAGFVALVALPLLLAVSAAARGLWVAWQPRSLDLVEPGGGAPRLAGWLAFVWLAAMALAWVMFQGTWLLAGVTAFKPQRIAWAEPVLAVATALVLVALSRPCARALAWLYGRIDARVRVTPSRVIVSLAFKT